MIEYTIAPPRSEDFGSLAPFLSRVAPHGLPESVTERRSLIRRAVELRAAELGGDSTTYAQDQAHRRALEAVARMRARLERQAADHVGQEPAYRHPGASAAQEHVSTVDYFMRGRRRRDWPAQSSHVDPGYGSLR